MQGRRRRQCTRALHPDVLHYCCSVHTCVVLHLCWYTAPVTMPLTAFLYLKIPSRHPVCPQLRSLENYKVQHLKYETNAVGGFAKSIHHHASINVSAPRRWYDIIHRWPIKSDRVPKNRQHDMYPVVPASNWRGLPTQQDANCRQLCKIHTTTHPLISSHRPRGGRSASAPG